MMIHLFVKRSTRNTTRARSSPISGYAPPQPSNLDHFYLKLTYLLVDDKLLDEVEP